MKEIDERTSKVFDLISKHTLSKSRIKLMKIPLYMKN